MQTTTPTASTTTTREYTFEGLRGTARTRVSVYAPSAALGAALLAFEPALAGWAWFLVEGAQGPGPSATYVAGSR